MPPPHAALPVTELERLLASLPLAPAGDEALPLNDAAFRICAEPVRAPAPQPPVPVSRMDGVAVAGVPKAGSYRLRGRSFPGDKPPPPPEPGDALEVMTGAPLPPGCMGVVPLEQVERDDDRVRIVQPGTVPPVPAGARVLRGDVLAGAGERLTPFHLGRLADSGIERVRVHLRPQVAVAAIGSELGAAAEHGGSLHARDGNTPTLCALIAGAGGTPHALPPLADDEQELSRGLGDLPEPLLITTGGTARGARDRTGKALERAGFRLLLDGLDLRPGQTVRIGIKGRRVWLSLPGMSGALGALFALLGGPLVQRAAGDSVPGPRWASGRLAADYGEARLAPVLANVRIRVEDATVFVTPAPGAGCDGHALLPRGEAPLSAGTVVPVLAPYSPYVAGR